MTLCRRGNISLPVSKLGEEQWEERACYWPNSATFTIFLQVGSIQFKYLKKGRQLLEMGTWKEKPAGSC